MKNHPERSTLLLLLILVLPLTAFYLWGMASVPFHPDESTYLFMSQDFKTLFTHPWQMAYEAQKSGDPQQQMRLRDAPLHRYLLGLSLSLHRLPGLPVDWDWSKSWAQNEQAGALPAANVLRAGRLAVTLLIPFSLVFIYLLGEKMGGKITGIAALLLLGTNALLLLHDRRAMAESLLTFGIIFALWSFLHGDRHAWLAGLGMALAFNAKHTAIVLLPIGLLAVIWPASPPPPPLPPKARTLALYLGVFGLLTLLLNPVWWNQPLAAVHASLQARQELLARQVADTQALAPARVLHTPGLRLAVSLGNLYLAPLSFSEVGNYTAQTAAVETAYLAIPGHNLLRSIPGGGLLLLLTLSGLALAGLTAARSPAARRPILLILLATLALVALQSLAVPLPWQRYVIPLLPLACLWGAYTVAITSHFSS